MLASRLPGIMPPLTEAEALETAAIASVSAQGLDLKQWGRRPFRAPHHTASGVALVGGGGQPRPGEISLAHHGVLFLDELPEYNRHVLEVLREPLESGRITISRAARQADFPARFQLVAAMNPCPCGYQGHASKPCTCSAESIARYQGKISGPFLDRIDLSVSVPSLSSEELNTQQAGESSCTVRERVIHARAKQLERQGKTNADLTPQELDTLALILPEARNLLGTLLDKLSLSARSFHRLLRVSRTIADLQNAQVVNKEHILQATAFRQSLN